MATITSTPTTSNLKVSGTTQVSGTISWSTPTVPSGVTITSCVLTGTATTTMSRGSAIITVNGTQVTSGTQFTINLGTANNKTSVTTTSTGENKNSSGTVSFSNLVYTVTYEVPKPTYTVTFVDWNKGFTNITSNLEVTAQYEENKTSVNINIGATSLSKVYIGDKEITGIYIGDKKIF